MAVGVWTVVACRFTAPSYEVWRLFSAESLFIMQWKNCYYLLSIFLPIITIIIIMV